MVLDKIVAARIAAYYEGWVDPDKFADCVKKGGVYIQRPHTMPQISFGFFAIGKDDTKFPIEKLVDMNLARHLIIVLPYDAGSTEILSVISSIEKSREAKRAEVDKNQWGKLDGWGIFETIVVAEVGKDPTSGETRYACDERFDSSSIERYRERGSLGPGKWITLTLVDEFARGIKKYVVPPEIKGQKLLTGKGVGGTAIGIVRNVGQPDPALLSKIRPDDIVVAVRLSPDVLQTYCQQVAGFITDRGGLACNTAVFAREKNIPATVGTQQATALLKDGDLVLVSGQTGNVYI